MKTRKINEFLERFGLILVVFFSDDPLTGLTEIKIMTLKKFGKTLGKKTPICDRKDS